ncbi:hypothetical protein A3Q56_02226 [Intoshia linei]|uniref:Uncharacterized protein n=1 Tax=Intoshia linei TaxID=1819745 RepID=A0A177B6W0_9BILA|nr:hypothetical protein A3Q56_02226 [Intoshia linei]
MDPLESNFSLLTLEEQKIIKDVVERQKKEEEKERKIKENTNDEIIKLQKKESEIRNQKVDDTICSLCRNTKFVEGTGKYCNMCKMKCCSRCCRPNKNDGYTCNLCRKKMELNLKNITISQTTPSNITTSKIVTPLQITKIIGDKENKMYSSFSETKIPIARPTDNSKSKFKPYNKNINKQIHNETDNITMKSVDQSLLINPVIKNHEKYDKHEKNVQNCANVSNPSNLYRNPHKQTTHIPLENTSGYNANNFNVKDPQQVNYFDSRSRDKKIYKNTQKNHLDGNIFVNESFDTADTSFRNYFEKHENYPKMHLQNKQNTFDETDREKYTINNQEIDPSCIDYSMHNNTTHSTPKKTNRSHNAINRKMYECEEEFSNFMPAVWTTSTDCNVLVGKMILPKVPLDRDSPFVIYLRSSLGFKVVGGLKTVEGYLGAFVTKVRKNGIADKVGGIRAGDEVVKWQTYNLRNLSFNQVYDIIHSAKKLKYINLIIHRYLEKKMLLYIPPEKKFIDNTIISKNSSINPRKLDQVVKYAGFIEVNHKSVFPKRGLESFQKLKIFYNIEKLCIHIGVLSCSIFIERADGYERNPYCVISFLSRNPIYRKTKTIYNTSNPVWNQTFLIYNVYKQDLFNVPLLCTVIDFDNLSHDECIGEVELNLNNIDIYNNICIYQLECKNSTLSFYHKSDNIENNQFFDSKTYSTSDNNVCNLGQDFNNNRPHKKKIKRMLPAIPIPITTSEIINARFRQEPYTERAYSDCVNDAHYQNRTQYSFQPNDFAYPKSNYLNQNYIRYPNSISYSRDKNYFNPEENLPYTSKNINYASDYEQEYRNPLQALQTHSIENRNLEPKLYNKMFMSNTKNRQDYRKNNKGYRIFNSQNDVNIEESDYFEKKNSFMNNQIIDNYHNAKPKYKHDYFKSRGIYDSKSNYSTESNNPYIQGRDSFSQFYDSSDPNKSSFGGENYHHEKLKNPNSTISLESNISDSNQELMHTHGSNKQFSKYKHSNHFIEEDDEEESSPITNKEKILHFRSISEESFQDNNEEETNVKTTVYHDNSDHQQLTSVISTSSQENTPDINVVKFSSKANRRKSLGYKVAALIGLCKKFSNHENVQFNRSEEIGTDVLKNNHCESIKRKENFHFDNFIEGIGPGQVVNRQIFGASCLGEIQLSLLMKNNNLIVEIIKARDFIYKSSKTLPATYAKIYLVSSAKHLIERQRTNCAKRMTCPLYQETLIFSSLKDAEFLQISIFAEYSKIERKSLVGIAQIRLTNLNLSNLVLGWYKLYNQFYAEIKINGDT